jgi:hypothetical protein
MRAGIGNTSGFQDHDAVGMADRGQPVRNHKHGSTGNQVLQRALHQRFRLCIEG